MVRCKYWEHENEYSIVLVMYVITNKTPEAEKEILGN